MNNTINAIRAAELANLFNEEKFFASRIHNYEDLFPLIEYRANEGKYDTNGINIRLDAKQYYDLVDLGYKIHMTTVESPVSQGKRIPINNVISWL